MILCWTVFISWLRATCALKIFPKVVWFQCLISPLRCFSFLWNIDILVPLEGLNLSQVDLTNSLKSRWVNQKASNQKGRLILLPGQFHWRAIGQWSEPETGRMEAMNSPPRWVALSDIRNLSRREAICCGPSLLLFHVNMPLFEGRSTSQLFWIKSFYMFPSLLLLLLPPYFYSILAIILKSPLDIQSGYSLFELSSDKVSKISALCMVSWGKYTLVIWSWVLVPIIWNIAWMKFLFACILSSWITRASQRTTSPPDAPWASTAVTSPPG